MLNPDYDINVPHELVNLHYSVWRLEHILNILVNKCSSAGIEITKTDIKEAGEAALERVRSNFPDREIVVNAFVIDG